MALRSASPARRLAGCGAALLLAACDGETAEVVLGTGLVPGAGGHPEVTAENGGTGPMNGAGSGGFMEFPRPPLCAVSEEPAPELAKEVYILLDRSGAMNEPLPGSPADTWWGAARDAVLRFVADPGSVSASVALQFFPHASNVPEDCEADFREPAVPFGLLPDHAAALASSFVGREPGGTRPLGRALLGPLEELSSRSRAGARHTAIVVLTRGLPAECPSAGADPIEQELSRLRRSGSSLSTHVVGLDVGEEAREFFDGVARAGGTPRATFIDRGDVASQIQGVLRSILHAPHGCWYGAPRTPFGPVPRMALANLEVSVRPRDGSLGHVLPRLEDLDDCAGDGELGWYPVEDAGGYGVALCPRACLGAVDSTITYSYAYECGRSHPPGH